MKKCTLSIIIPTFNDAHIIRKNLPGFKAFLETENISYEIIIVDDGSDNPGVCEELAATQGCRLLKNPKNLGKGAAVRKGMLAASGEFRVFTDVDIPFHFDSIPAFLRYLDFKEFDLVVGDRTLPGSEYYSKIPATREIASNIFSFIVGRFVAGGVFRHTMRPERFPGRGRRRYFLARPYQQFCF